MNLIFSINIYIYYFKFYVFIIDYIDKLIMNIVCMELYIYIYYCMVLNYSNYLIMFG